MACDYCFPTRTIVLNKFRILKERHVQMRKPYQSPGRMKNSSYYIVHGPEAEIALIGTTSGGKG